MKIKGETIDEIKGIPVELISFDEETGEICIGDECFNIQYNPETSTVVVEINPESQSCSRLMRTVAKRFLKQIAEGRPKVKFREIHRFDNDEEEL